MTPGLVDLQIDLYWTVARGADPVTYLDAHPGRYRLIHIKDIGSFRCGRAFDGRRLPEVGDGRCCGPGRVAPPPWS